MTGWFFEPSSLDDDLPHSLGSHLLAMNDLADYCGVCGPSCSRCFPRLALFHQLLAPRRISGRFCFWICRLFEGLLVREALGLFCFGFLLFGLFGSG